MVGTLVKAATAADPDTMAAVVSDHGFASVERDVNLFKAFTEAGLITIDGGKVKSWEAMPWFAGGSAAVVLARREDSALRAKVAALLARLRADPALGIAELFDHTGIAERGGGGEADFWIGFKPGTEAGRKSDAPLVAPAASKGMHGYDPALPEMRSTFLILGRGLPWKGDLGEIDMRRIAPTLAKLMGADLPSAELPPIGSPAR